MRPPPSPPASRSARLKRPRAGSADSGDDRSPTRSVRPAQRRARSTGRRSAAKSKGKFQPPVKKTATETEVTSAELLPSAASGDQAVVDKAQQPRVEEEEAKAQRRPPSPPYDFLGFTLGLEDQCKAHYAVDTKAELQFTEFKVMGKAPLEREVCKRRRSEVNYKEEEDLDDDDYVCEGMLHCSHCDYPCLGQDRLDKHVKWRHGNIGRDGRHKCEWCEYSTDKAYHMKHHRRTHTGERPHRCDDCGKTFTRLHTLTLHRRIHFGQRPHGCDVCGKTFTQASHLTVHRRIHTGEKVCQCEQCGATFTDHSAYIQHMKSHNGVKAHRCQVCSARFVTRAHLTRHTRTHTGERPYGCSFCPARFTRQSSMKTHVTTLHTHDYGHRCGRCGKGFVAPRALRKHADRCSAAK